MLRRLYLHLSNMVNEISIVSGYRDLKREAVKPRIFNKVWWLLLWEKHRGWVANPPTSNGLKRPSLVISQVSVGWMTQSVDLCGSLLTSLWVTSGSAELWQSFFRWLCSFAFLLGPSGYLRHASQLWQGQGNRQDLDFLLPRLSAGTQFLLPGCKRGKHINQVQRPVSCIEKSLKQHRPHGTMVTRASLKIINRPVSGIST